MSDSTLELALTANKASKSIHAVVFLRSPAERLPWVMRLREVLQLRAVVQSNDEIFRYTNGLDIKRATIIEVTCYFRYRASKVTTRGIERQTHLCIDGTR